MTDKIVVLVTCGSVREAEKIGRALIAERLAACANVVRAPLQSIYRWKGRVESAREFLMVLKTTRRQFASLERAIKRLHSYDVPEIISLPIGSGSRDYLKWIGESVGTRRPQARKRA